MARKRKKNRTSGQPKNTKNYTKHVVNREVQNFARREQKRERRVFVPQDDRRIKDMLDDLYYRPERVYHTAHGTPVDVHQLPDNVNLKKRQDYIENIPRDRPSFDSDRVSVCERRKERREVLFALNRTRKGAGSRKHKWSEISNIVCRRH